MIKELLRVKFGFMSLPLFDAEQLDCMLDALCTEYSLYFTFYILLFVLHVRFHNKYNIDTVSQN